jgi:hypothetical protein
MDFGKTSVRLLAWLGVAQLQLIMTQVVTFPQTHAALFVVI